MKDYKKFITFIVTFSIGLYLLNNLLKNNLFSISIISLIIFLLFLFWDNYLWKIDKLKNIKSLLAKLIGFYNYPNISGNWDVKYSSSYNPKEDGGYQTFGDGKSSIKQTYSKIFMNIRFENESKSENYFTKLEEKPDGSWMLIYYYKNTPLNETLSNSKSGGMHEGFCCLNIVNENYMEGYYTNDENRKTRGKMEFYKV